jgi:hypothetical protein
VRIDIIHQRDPDSECSLTVYVDGKPVQDYHYWSFDPGAGYEMDEFDAEAAEAVADAPEHLKPVLAEIYDEMRETYERWSL